jgi:IS5 family transposase
LARTSSLLGDGVRVLKKVTAVARQAGTQMRDRSRSAKRKVLAIARASRNKTEKGRQKMKNAYIQLLEITSRVVGQAKKFSARSPDASSEAIYRSYTRPRSDSTR